MKSLNATILAAAVLSLASCGHRDADLDPNLHGFFPEDAGETRHVDKVVAAQAAAGARADGMLHGQHFDGPRLNSLGEQKLSDMLRDDDAAMPLTVYLKLDERDAASAGRRAAVVTYLKDQGLTDNQVAIVYGENPGSRSAASLYLGKSGKTETGAAAGGTTGGGGDASGPADTGSDAGGNDGGVSTVK